MIPRKVCYLVPLLALLIGVPAAGGKNALTLPDVKDSRVANLQPVTAPEVRCAAVSDNGWLAFGHRPTYKKGHVSLFRLDAQGKPAAAVATLLTIPHPAAVARNPNSPVSLVFHPKLPLLYVWQDIQLPPNAPPLPAATVKDLDHLLIYSLEKPAPELILSLCRGPEFAHGKTLGSVAVDSAGKRLFIPNLQDPKNAAAVMLGAYDLDADGLPVWSDRSVPKGAAKAARVAAINAAKVAGKPVLPQSLTPYDSTYTFPVSPFGCGYGMVPITDRVLLFGGPYGVMGWEPSNRRVKVHGMFLENFARPYAVAGHPTLPVVYATSLTYNVAFRLKHADGYLTLMPQKVELTGATLLSPPAVMGRSGKVAFGGSRRVYFVGLNDKGDFKPERTQVVVDNPAVEALVYSEKFDRLYVPVEISK
jgi:hypothetical protein